MKNILLLLILFTGLVSWGQDYSYTIEKFSSNNEKNKVFVYNYTFPYYLKSIKLIFDPKVVPDAFYIKYGDQEFWSGFVGDVYNTSEGLYTMASVSADIKNRFYKDIFPSDYTEENDASVVDRLPRNFAAELVWYKQKDGLLEAINAEIGKVGGKPINSIFKKGDDNAEKITNSIVNTKEKLVNIYKSYGDDLKGERDFIINKQNGVNEITIIVFSPLHGRLFDILVNTCASCGDPDALPISGLTLSDNTYRLNNSKFSGKIDLTYPSTQLKESFQVKDGKIEGDKIIYHQDNSFRKDQYKDTTLITKLESNLTTLNNELSALEKDSSSFNNRKNELKSEMGDKYDKYKEKYNEGKLKGKKLELYEDYLIYTKKLKEKTLDVGEKRIERNKVEQKLNTEKNKSEYSNKKKDVFQYSNGLCSFHKEFDKNEKLVLEEELKDGVRNGFFKRYKNEVIVEEGTYSNGLMTGAWIFRHDNGNLKGQGNYVNGDMGEKDKTGIPKKGREGNWVLYHENGNISKERNYTNGLPTGINKAYYKSGKIWTINNYVQEGSELVPDGENLIYYENGKLQEKSFWNMGKRHGKTILFYENGNKDKEGYYNNHLADGPWKNYYENGNLHYDFEMRNGKSEFDGAVQSVYKENGEFDKKIQWNGTEWVDYVSPEEKERRRVEWENHQKELLTMKHKCRRCNSEYVGQGWDYHLGDEALSKFYRVDKNCSVTRSLIREENDYCSESCASQSCEREKERRGW